MYLNGTRAFREAQKDAKDLLKACTEPHPKGGAEQKMSRGPALLARLDNAPRQNRAFDRAPFARPRMVNERAALEGEY